jgi:hypothetical protein
VGNLKDKAILTLRKCKNQSLWISWNPTSEIVHISVLHAETKIWHMLQCGYWTVSNINLFYASPHFYFLSYSSLYSSSSTYQTLRHIPTLYIPHLPIKFQSILPFDFRLPISSLPQFTFITFSLPSTSLLYRLSSYFLPVVSYKLSGTISMTCTGQR